MFQTYDTKTIYKSYSPVCAFYVNKQPVCVQLSQYIVKVCQK